MQDTNRLSGDEMFNSLTGFDEIAVAKSFGRSPLDLARANEETNLLRALVFVDLRRNGSSDADAYQAVMGMSLKDIAGYFAAADADPFRGESD